MKKIKKINFSLGVVLLCSLLWLMPLVLIFFNSFKSYGDMMSSFLSLPKSWSLDMYVETWVDFNFPLLIKNTLLYTVGSVCGIVLFAPMAAYKLSRTKSFFSTICFSLIIMPMMVPFTSYMITMTKLASKLGWTGTRLGYILLQIGMLMPLAVFMIHGFVKTVPMELEECAYVDGASKIRIYFQIVFPLLRPIVSTIVVLDTLAVWNDTILNQLIVGGKMNAMNLNNQLYMRFSAETSDWEHALPGIVMVMIPSLIFFIAMQKNIMSGITAGAVKG